MYRFISLLVCFLLVSFMQGTRELDEGFGRNHNVCKKLKGRVLVYVICVENNTTTKWTSFDLATTSESLNSTLSWIEAEAQESGISLNLLLHNDINDSSAVVNQKLGGSIPEFVQSPEGLVKIDKWTDRIIKIASGKRSKLELVTSLRNEYKAESVALIFMQYNYVQSDFIYTFNTASNLNVEYAVISTKRPSLIAQTIFSLFGAPYLYHHPSTTNKRNTKQVQRIFHDDVMANADYELNQLGLGPISRYFIGWADTLSTEYDRLIKEKPKF